MISCCLFKAYLAYWILAGTWGFTPGGQVGHPEPLHECAIRWRLGWSGDVERCVGSTPNWGTYLVAHPTNRKWVITPSDLHGIRSGLIHINHWGYNPQPRFVGWATKYHTIMSLCKRIYFQDLPSFMAQNMVPGDFQTELESKLLLVEIPISASLATPRKIAKQNPTKRVTQWVFYLLCRPLCHQ